MRTSIRFNEDCTYTFDGSSQDQLQSKERIWRIHEDCGIKRLQFKEVRYSRGDWGDFFHGMQGPEIDEFIAKLETWFVEVTLFNIDSETIEAQGDN
jgi:hypothetical protein